MHTLLKTWGIGMFSFGFIREWNSMIYKHRKDDYSSRVLFSYFNGLYYASPLGVVKLYHAYQRLKDNKYNKYNKYNDNNDNNSIYYEILGTNYETFL